MYGIVYYKLSVIDQVPKKKKIEFDEFNFPLLQHVEPIEGFTLFNVQSNPNSYFYIQNSQEAVIKALKNLKF